jgi:type I restriction enzyme S subunit
MTVGAFCSIFRPKVGCDDRFVAHVFQSQQYRQHIDVVLAGSAINNLQNKTVENLQLLAPSYLDQQKIAQILDTLDTQIQKTKALIAKLEKIKEGLLHDLLTRGIDQNGQLRLTPDQAPGIYKESALGLIPKEWEATTVGELGVWRGGATPSKGNQKFWPSQGLLWVSPKDLNQDIIDITEDKVSELACGVANLTIFPPETVLVVFRSGILRRKLPVVKVLKMFTVNQDIKALLPSDEISKGFIHYLLQGHAKGILNSSLKAGTTVESLDFRFFSSYRLPLPPLDEQEKISARLGSIEKRLAQEIKFLEKQKINKIGLMDDLLTGHVRVTPLLKDAV